jgi:hypothetical protein
MKHLCSVTRTDGRAMLLLQQESKCIAATIRLIISDVPTMPLGMMFARTAAFRSSTITSLAGINGAFFLSLILDDAELVRYTRGAFTSSERASEASTFLPAADFHDHFLAQYIAGPEHPPRWSRQQSACGVSANKQSGRATLPRG